MLFLPVDMSAEEQRRNRPGEYFEAKMIVQDPAKQLSQKEVAWLMCQLPKVK